MLDYFSKKIEANEMENDIEVIKCKLSTEIAKSYRDINIETLFALTGKFAV